MSSQILVIDDSATVRSELRDALAGFDVIEAMDGLEGAEVIEKNRDVALAFCDVNMPRLDGIAMLRRIHDRMANEALTIVMLTTEAQPELIREARSLGARGWMVKPFDPVQISAIATKFCAPA